MAERAKITEILDAVVEEINSRAWALSFTAERVSAINTELTDSHLHVLVTESGEIDIQRNTRGQRIEIYGVRIGVLKRVSFPSNDQVDPLRFLCQQLSDLYFVTEDNPQQRIGETDAVVTEIPQVLYDPDNLLVNSQFTWLMQLSVEVTR